MVVVVEDAVMVGRYVCDCWTCWWFCVTELFTSSTMRLFTLEMLEVFFTLFVTLFVCVFDRFVVVFAMFLCTFVTFVTFVTLFTLETRLSVTFVVV